MPTKPHKLLYAISSIAGVAMTILYFIGTPLPSPAQISQKISGDEPKQVDTADGKPFSRTWGDEHYTFTPHASYELSGLVVSLHHSDSWIDISHENDPAQTVDICVVWGQNIISNGYRMVSYTHGDFTCYYRWYSRDAPPFSGSLLSNNHLVPSTPELARLIKTVRVGDQITLTGMLVDYEIRNTQGDKIGWRHTSLTRDDADNGACEIIYLTNARIIKRNMPWRAPLMNALLFLLIGGSVGGFYVSMPKHPSGVSSAFEENKPDPRNPLDPRNLKK